MSEKVLDIRRELIRKYKKKKPRFKRQNWWRYKRILDGWRKPRGRHSKHRKHKGSRSKMPGIGYGTPHVIKGLHPTGYQEIMVRKMDDLKKIEPDIQAARIIRNMGKKKKQELTKKAGELKIKVLNP